MSEQNSNLTRLQVLPPLEENGPKRIRVQKWFGSTRELAAVQSVCSHINNMFTGVQRVRFTHDMFTVAHDLIGYIVFGCAQGYKYTMKLVYAHFPINVNPTDGGKSLEIRNFLGEKVIRRVPMKEGVKVDKTGNKDEIALEGNSIENVGSSGTSCNTNTPPFFLLAVGQTCRKPSLSHGPFHAG